MSRRKHGKRPPQKPQVQQEKKQVILRLIDDENRDKYIYFPDLADYHLRQLRGHLFSHTVHGQQEAAIEPFDPEDPLHQKAKREHEERKCTTRPDRP